MPCRELTSDEYAVLDKLKSAYLIYQQNFVPENKDVPFNTKTIDLVFFRCAKQEHVLENNIVAVTAFALGHNFIQHLGYSWKINEDYLGKEYVLESSDGVHVIYPFSLVQQKFDKHECGFVKKLSEMYYDLKLNSI